MNSKTQILWQDEAGFTLIELLMYVSLAGFLFMGAFYVFVKSTDIYTGVLRTSMIVQNARKASEILEHESKNVRDKNSILIATSTEFKFTNTTNAVVDFVYSAQQLTNNGTVLAGNITGFTFSYQKWDGTTWTSASPTTQIAIIKVNFTMAYLGYTFTKDHSFVLRNMR
jgi:type II secretory pathway pseudopilin PulG